jgi:hypothetical protein
VRDQREARQQLRAQRAVSGVQSGQRFLEQRRARVVDGADLEEPAEAQRRPREGLRPAEAPGEGGGGEARLAFAGHVAGQHARPCQGQQQLAARRRSLLVHAVEHGDGALQVRAGVLVGRARHGMLGGALGVAHRPSGVAPPARRFEKVVRQIRKGQLDPRVCRGLDRLADPLVQLGALRVWQILVQRVAQDGVGKSPPARP